MLTSLRIRRFHAWDDTGPVRLAVLTLFLGEHGTGKSSLRHALGALKEAVPPLPPRSQVAIEIDGGQRSINWPTSDALASDTDRLRALARLSFIQAEATGGAPPLSAQAKNWLTAMGLGPDHTSAGALHARHILSRLGSTRAGDTLWLEHPESFLHPRAQAALMDALIDTTLTAAEAGVDRTQLVIETHSEAMLNRLQRRVAEGVIQAKDVALFVCRRPAQHAELQALRLSPYGDIENWPEDLFGHDMSDAIARTLAAAQRRQVDEQERSA